MEKQPLVSIIIPCYNHEKFLDDCITSILRQDYENIEVLICDDYSIDGSFEKIKLYEDRMQRRFKRVVIMQNDINQGVTKNLNKMLLKAKGEFIKIIASDDLMAETAISKFVSFLIEFPQIDMVIANGARITEEQHYPNVDYGAPIYGDVPDVTSSGLFSRIFILNEIFAPGVMIRKSVYDRYGFYDEEIAIEDFEFWLRILKDEKIKVGYLDDILVFYRINSNSMTAQTNNPGLEKRRIRFHTAEIQILDKYGQFVSPSTYAETKIKRILAEKFFAINHGLRELENIVDKEFRSYHLWKYLSAKKAIYNYCKFIEANFKKWLIVMKVIDGNKGDENELRKKGKGC